MGRCHTHGAVGTVASWPAEGQPQRPAAVTGGRSVRVTVSERCGKSEFGPPPICKHRASVGNILERVEPWAVGRRAPWSG